MAKINRYLSLKLKLKVNSEKSQVVKIEELEYLGFTFRGIRIFVSDRALKDFKHRLRGLTSRSWGVSMLERIQRLNRYLRGWMNYSSTPRLELGPKAELAERLWYFPALHPNGGVRRMAEATDTDVLLETDFGERSVEPWRRLRTRISRLLKLGTSKRQAILTGISRKGYWRLSKTLVTHTGMINEWLEQQGLLSIRQLWMKVQGYASFISVVCASS
jgi:RNA-directed DNA polymerase